MKHLSERAIQIYQYIVDYIEEHTYPPTLREIAEGLNISLSSAYYHLQKLRDWHYITYPHYSSRSIELTNKKPK